MNKNSYSRIKVTKTLVLTQLIKQFLAIIEDNIEVFYWQSDFKMGPSNFLCAS